MISFDSFQSAKFGYLKPATIQLTIKGTATFIYNTESLISNICFQTMLMNGIDIEFGETYGMRKVVQ